VRVPHEREAERVGGVGAGAGVAEFAATLATDAVGPRAATDRREHAECAAERAAEHAAGGGRGAAGGPAAGEEDGHQDQEN
jgi:hypothetical protein